MRCRNVSVWLSLFITIAGIFSSSAGQPPVSAEHLRGAFEWAINTRDTNGLLELFNWQGVSDHIKQGMRNQVEYMFQQKITAVKLAPLPADFQPDTEISGTRYKQNVTVVGQIEVDFDPKGTYLRLPFGTNGNAYFLSCTIEEKLHLVPTTPQPLDILVKGSAMADATMLSGSFVYVRDGQELKEEINARGNFSKGFFGDYIKSCTVQKQASDRHQIRLIIMEDGKKLFESESVTNETPIVYERK